jgi:hypothetical protein
MSYGSLNTKPQSVPAIAELWRNRIEIIYGEPSPALTLKQFGQLKQLREKLQECTWYVVYGAIGIWPQFSQEAQASAGLLSSPNKPHIGFLLTHYDVAVNLLRSLAKNSDSPAAVEFVKMLDRKIAEQKKEWAGEG